MLQLPDKIRKTGRKRDAILTHHFRQRAGLLCCRAGTGSAGAALPWLARTILFLAAPDPAPSRKPVSMSSPPICAGSAGPARPPISAPTPSSTMSATWSRWWRRLAKSRPSSSAMTGARRSPGTRRCSGPMSSPRSRASAFRRPSRGRGLPLETLRQNGITNFYWQYFQPPGVAEAEFERDVAATMRIVLGGRGFSDPAAHQYRSGGQGLPRRRRSESAAAELADRGRPRLFRGRLPGSPAFAAG